MQLSTPLGCVGVTLVLLASGLSSADDLDRFSPSSKRLIETIRPLAQDQKWKRTPWLVDLDEAHAESLAGVDVEYPVGAGPVLHAAAELVLLFLGTGGEGEGQRHEHGGPKLVCGHCDSPVVIGGAKLATITAICQPVVHETQS